jgi:polysaccharide export outer membrane protein
MRTLDLLTALARRVFLTFLLALTLAACSQNTSLKGSSMEANGQFTQTGSDGAVPPKAATSADKIFSANAAGNSGGGDYRIAPLDVIEITVLGVPELTKTAQIASSGIITLPLIKDVKAGGKTTAELEREITRRLQVTYMQQPQVSVFVKEYNSQRITVDGAVNKPGIYPISGRTTLLQGLALGQGLSELADPAGVIIFRQVNGKRMAARFDIRNVRGGRMEDPMLAAGDIIMVDESSGKSTLRDVKNFLPLSGVFRLMLL